MKTLIEFEKLNLAFVVLRYTTADNLGIYARNDYKQAGTLVTRLGGHPKTLFSLKKPGDSSKFMFPTPCSLLDAFLWYFLILRLLLHLICLLQLNHHWNPLQDFESPPLILSPCVRYIDFNSTPRLKVLKQLAHYAENPKEKAQLLAFANEQKEEFNEDQKSLFEVLMEFPSVRPPMEHFLEFAPKLLPRFYTISSSSRAQPTKISVTSSLLFGSKPRGREFKGVCTHYLKSLKPGQRVCVFVRNSTFRLPRKLATTPIIMCGPGTGLAPFRGFLQEFTHLKHKDGTVVESRLFFGCKKSTQDYIYQDELEAAREGGVLTDLHLAFSREMDKKMYVQDRLQEHGRDVWHQIFAKGGYFYVCGATSMGRQVKDVLVSLAVTYGGFSQSEAANFIERLHKEGRYVQELWS